jgi:AcrR family transcriptional regulator
MRMQQRGRPRGASSEHTAERILRAARVCFGRMGYAGTTMKDIADEAELTQAALYMYFDSKTALYIGTMRYAYSEILPLYREAVAGVRSVRDGFRAILSASARVHERDPSLAEFFSALPVEMRRHDEVTREVAAAGDEVVRLFQGVVTVGVREGEITAASAPYVLSLFIACTMGFSLFAATIDSSQIGGIIDAFSALIDGKLFHARRRAAKPKAKRKRRP